MYIFYQLLNGSAASVFIAWRTTGWCYSEAVYPSECEWLVPGTFNPDDG